MKGYIYLITNLINNKVYVGQTYTTVEERWRKHCSVALNDTNATGIDGAIRKYGKNNFQCETIYECDARELDKWEQYYIQQYNSYQGDNADHGYNLTRGGQGGYIYNIDEDEMLAMYNGGMTAVEIAQYYGCSDKTIGNRLKKYNVNTKLHQQQWLAAHSAAWNENLKKGRYSTTSPVLIIEYNVVCDSIRQCAHYLLEQQILQGMSEDAAYKGIQRVLNGDRKSYHQLHFKYVE